MERQRVTGTAENYLKRIYAELEGEERRLLPMKRLADSMAVAPGTATSMMKSLAAAGLVVYEPRKGCRLTDRGRDAAVRVLRRHRLIERFLVDVLRLDWSEVHREAEVLEHVVSDRVIDSIDALLRHPSEDSHGDPIPSKSGEFHPAHPLPLTRARGGERIRLSRVAEDDAELLAFVKQHGLLPGVEVVVESRSPGLGLVTVRLQGKRPVTLGDAAARRIYYLPSATSRSPTSPG